MTDPRERYAIVPAGLVGDKHVLVDMFAGGIEVSSWDTWDEAEREIDRLLKQAGVV